MPDIHWVDRRAVLLLHEEGLAEHGGLRGVRDGGGLESALTRPQNLLHYNEDISLAQLAAAYGFGIARSHPFSDGNKRAAFLTLDLFCMLNGWRVQTTQVDVVMTMLSLAAGELTEEQLAAWIDAHIVPLEPKP